MKKSNRYESVIIDEFKLLKDQYGISLVEIKSEDWGVKCKYIGEVVGVSVLFEFREAYINVTINRLQNGRIIPDVYPLIKGAKVNNINLDFFVMHIDKKRMVKPLYDSTSDYYGKENAFEIMTARTAKNLYDLCGDILNGDFDLFEEVSPEVINFFSK
ncbi:hypothetical protein [Leptospira licerasiae]|uniref:hypothetical protein n=1 Tax=Leptospira licerasiae TaxID=447106 RepID=UPI0010843F3E|nr:hypothetical protein [Leptospira licerasiae]TGM94954.1 hypothetical protein EHR05_02545 [Leptospira licerasiae]